ncbi:MAG: LamG-like jellyroll fold domain-containing protein [Opitutales bacterium]
MLTLKFAVCTLVATVLTSKALIATTLPIRINTWDGKPESREITVRPDAPADRIYLQVHGLRFGGQMSVKINDNDWLNVYNDTVELHPNEEKLLGIGGTYSTIRYYIPGSDLTPGQSNRLTFRLNGTDGFTTGIRIIDIDLLDDQGDSVLPVSTFLEEDPTKWTAPYSPDQFDGAEKIEQGGQLWAKRDILFENFLTKTPIRASCADCHFDDGSDLKYFNFANETIISRARFHGLSEEQGKRIASYIRSIDLRLPTGMEPPGRPWNPPYQPGPGTDYEPGATQHQIAVAGASWLAGRGLEAVKDSDQEVFETIFPQGADYGTVAEWMDTLATLSIREMPLTIQLPDWNQWLPRVAPIDMWPDDLLLRDVRVAQGDPNDTTVNPPIDLDKFSDPDIPLWQGPEDLRDSLKGELDQYGPRGLARQGELNLSFGRFNMDIVDHWYGYFRSSAESNDELWQAAQQHSDVTYDEMRMGILKWRLVKGTELIRSYQLETIQEEPVGLFGPETSPNYTPEPLNYPSHGPRSAAWAIAPHISANNRKYFEQQEHRHGKTMSNQWYLLQQVLNAGSRKSGGMNDPVDWDYLKLHMQQAGYFTGHDFSMTRLFNHIKMAQSRRIGVGITKDGFSMRTMSPNFFYAEVEPRWDIYKSLNYIEPRMFDRFFEEYLYEFIDIMGQYDTTTMERSDYWQSNPIYENRQHFINAADNIPSPWKKGTSSYFLRPNENFLTSTYRLIPLLLEDDINPAVVEDLLDWLKFAYPKHSLWDNPPLEVSDPDGDGVIDFPTVPYWDEYVDPSKNYIFLENFESGTVDESYSGVTFIETKDSATYTHLDTAPRGSGGRYVGRRGISADANSDRIRNSHLNQLSINVSPGQSLRVSMRTAFRVLDDDPTGENVRTLMRITFDQGGTIEGESIEMNPSLFNDKFQTYASEITVPANASRITNVHLRWIRSAGGTSHSNVFFDNILIQNLDLDPNAWLTSDQVPNVKNLTPSQSMHRILVRWDRPVNRENIKGYRIYRWEEKADPNDNSEEISITRAPIWPGDREYQDQMITPGVTYRYRVSAIGVNGDELADTSRHVGGSLDGSVPNIPMRHQYLEELDNGGVRLAWFGVPNLDILGYRVFRRPLGNTNWERLSGHYITDLTFDDVTADPSVVYEYYMSPYTASAGAFPNQQNSLIFDPYETAAQRANDTDLVAYIDFDGGVSDALGNLTLFVGNPDNVEPGAGVNGDAYRITRPFEKVGIGDSELLNTGSYFPRRTISLWFKLDAIGGPQTIFEEGGLKLGFHIYMIDDTLYAGAYHVDAGWDGTWRKVSGVTAGEWHHVALVLDADFSPDVVAEDQLFAYLNGIEFDPTNSAAMALGRHNNDAGIGGIQSETLTHDGSAPANMVGLVDEFAVWNRALSHAEIASLAGQQINYTLDSFRSRYLLASDGSDDYKDWSGNGLANITYYFFGLGDPRQAHLPSLERGTYPAAGLPIIEVGSGIGDFNFSYVRNKHQSAYDYILQYSSNLESWNDIDTLAPEYQPISSSLIEDIDSTYEIVTEDLNFADSSGYFRIEVRSR